MAKLSKFNQRLIDAKLSTISERIVCNLNTLSKRATKQHWILRKAKTHSARPSTKAIVDRTITSYKFTHAVLDAAIDRIFYLEEKLKQLNNQNIPTNGTNSINPKNNT